MSSDETDNADLIVLHIWPGEWNLPSLDPECLVALVCSKDLFWGVTLLLIIFLFCLSVF